MNKTKFIDIFLIEQEEKESTYPAARFCKDFKGNVSYLTIAKSMVCVAECLLDFVPEHQQASAEKHLMEAFNHAWGKKNKCLEHFEDRD